MDFGLLGRLFENAVDQPALQQAMKDMMGDLGGGFAPVLEDGTSLVSQATGIFEDGTPDIYLDETNLGLLGKALGGFGGDIGDMESQKRIQGSPLMSMPRGTPQLLKDYDQSRIMQMPQFEPPELIVPGLLNPMRGYF